MAWVNDFLVLLLCGEKPYIGIICDVYVGNLFPEWGLFLLYILFAVVTASSFHSLEIHQ